MSKNSHIVCDSCSQCFVCKHCEAYEKFPAFPLKVDEFTKIGKEFMKKHEKCKKTGSLNKP